MKAYWWELGLSVFGLLLAALFFLGHAPFNGVVFLVCSVLWLVYRLRPAGGSRPGAFAFGGALLDALRALAVWLTIAVTCVLLFISSLERWGHDLRGQVATIALGGLLFFLAREFNRVSDRAFLRYDGGIAEERVVECLEPLEASGWVIENNRLREDGFGDIDLIARAPSTNVYAIETKSRGRGYRAVGQAVGGAVWLQKRLGVRWVTAVVCVPGDVAAHRYGAGWIVGADRLAEWLRSDPNRR